MARACAICGKKTSAGRSISHAHNVTNRTFKPNLQRVRAMIDGVPRRVYVCTRCVRSGRVEKPPVHRRPEAEAEAEA